MAILPFITAAAGLGLGLAALVTGAFNNRKRKKPSTMTNTTRIKIDNL
jgi:hypothetical protein